MLDALLVNKAALSRENAALNPACAYLAAFSKNWALPPVLLPACSRPPLAFIMPTSARCCDIAASPAAFLALNCASPIALIVSRHFWSTFASLSNLLLRQTLSALRFFVSYASIFSWFCRCRSRFSKAVNSCSSLKVPTRSRISKLKPAA